MGADLRLVHFVLGLVLSQTAQARNTTEGENPGVPTTPPAPDHGEDILTRPIDKGMKPVYTMTNFFLETIINPPSLARLNEKVELSDWEAVVDSLRTDWQMWLRHHYGYLICVVVGVAYALTMITVGVTICCCRCRGRCGAKPEKTRDGRHTGHKRRTCATVLFILLVPIMLGTVAAFIANQLVYEETNPSGMTSTFSDSISRLGAFQVSVAQSFEHFVGEGVEQSVDEIKFDLSYMPERCSNIVGDNTTAGPLLDSLQQYTDELNNTLTDLQAIDELSEDLVQASDDVESQIKDLQRNMTIDLDFCNDSLCHMALEKINSLSVQINYSEAVNLMAEAITAVQNVTTGRSSIFAGVADALQEYEKVFQALNSSLSEEIQDLVKLAATFNDEVQVFVNYTNVQLQSVSLTDAQDFVNGTMSPWLQRAGDIRYYTCIGIGCILVILTVLFLIALAYGICGERAGKDAQCCNRGNSASLLVTTSYLVFSISWLLMLASSFLLVIGGVAHTDLCQHMVRMEDSEVLEVFDDIIQANVGINISATETYSNCKEDQAIYTAANMEKLGQEYNITYLLDLDLYGIPEKLKELTDVNITIGNLVLTNEILRSNLQILDNGLYSLNFSTHDEQLSKDITSIPLQEVQTFLRECAENSSSAELSAIFLYYSNETRRLQDEYVAELQAMQSSLQSVITSVKNFQSSLDPMEFLSDLTAAQDTIDSAVLSMAVTTGAVEILDKFEDTTTKAESLVRNELGHCQSVYTATADSVTAACVKFLYPFNAFWFSFGWCLFFFIFTIPLALVLAGYYERTDKYSKLAEAGVLYDLGIDPDVPRQSVHRKKGKNTRQSPAPPNGVTDFELQAMNLYGRSPIDGPGLANVNEGYVVDDNDDGGFTSHHSNETRERQLSSRRPDNKRQRSRDNETHYEQLNSGYNDHFHSGAGLPTDEGPGPYIGRHDDNSAYSIHASPHQYDPRSQDQGFLNSAYF